MIRSGADVNVKANVSTPPIPISDISYHNIYYIIYLIFYDLSIVWYLVIYVQCGCLCGMILLPISSIYYRMGGLLSIGLLRIMPEKLLSYWYDLELMSGQCKHSSHSNIWYIAILLQFLLYYLFDILWLVYHMTSVHICTVWVFMWYDIVTHLIHIL